MQYTQLHFIHSQAQHNIISFISNIQVFIWKTYLLQSLLSNESSLIKWLSSVVFTLCNAIYFFFSIWISPFCYVTISFILFTFLYISNLEIWDKAESRCCFLLLQSSWPCYRSFPIPNHDSIAGMGLITQRPYVTSLFPFFLFFFLLFSFCFIFFTFFLYTYFFEKGIKQNKINKNKK